MSSIVFYEKPGCAGNAKQRALLQAAAPTLIRRDLLSERWTADSPLEFLARRCQCACGSTERRRASRAAFWFPNHWMPSRRSARHFRNRC
jgi:hypothetical protein